MAEAAVAATKKPKINNALQALTSAALILPGLVPTTTLADTEEPQSYFQYSHYEEGKRDLINISSDRAPLSVDTFQLGSGFNISNRIHFGFNVVQDTWSGATPFSTAPLAINSNTPILKNSDNGVVIVGASPLLVGQVLLDQSLMPLTLSEGTQTPVKDNRLVHILSSASPETRQQADFNLAYQWNEAELILNGGLSLENDYKSHFGGISGRWDLNQKATSLKTSLNYTHSNIAAIIDHDAAPYLTKTAYKSQIELREGSEILHGTRQDWAASWGINQLINKKAFVEANLSYTHSSGYLSNPYKATTVIFVDPNAFDNNQTINGNVQALLEQRPNSRNQWAISANYVQYIDMSDAALHVNYQFSHDDWGLESHTFAAKWVQPLGQGWSISPRIRYYSQGSASFYQPYLVSVQNFRQSQVDATGREIWVDVSNPNNGVEYFRDDFFNLVDNAGNLVDESTLNVRNKTETFDATKLPKYFSSDHRLSGYGVLSGGITLDKQFTKGISLQAGFEYYSHAGNLKLGGGGESSFADFDYYVANAALSVDLDAAAQTLSSHQHHHKQGKHHAMPTGLRFAHMLTQADSWMFGYSFMHSQRQGLMKQGSKSVSDEAVVQQSCGTDLCRFTQSDMTMGMHMLNIMYAPTDWLNIMLMPQFVSMSMNLRELEGRPAARADVHEHSGVGGHTTGGVGDTVVAALLQLWQGSGQQVHAGLGLSAPTGAVDLEFRRIARADGGLVHFGMQLGSGTWDFLPSLTYTGVHNNYSWGAQVNATVRMQAQNKSGYRLGNRVETTAWLSYQMLSWLSTSVRGIYSAEEAISGDFNAFNSRIGPIDYPNNYGGQFWDIGLGLSTQMPHGELAGNRLSFEWLQPLHTDFNGAQLQRDGALVVSWRYMF